MSYDKTTWQSGDVITAVKLNNIESGVEDINMSYTKTTWQSGDVITAAKLNNIEDGIEGASGPNITWWAEPQEATVYYDENLDMNAIKPVSVTFTEEQLAALFASGAITHSVFGNSTVETAFRGDENDPGYYRVAYIYTDNDEPNMNWYNITPDDNGKLPAVYSSGQVGDKVQVAVGFITAS